MMTAKATLVLILAYVLALAAGTTSGVLAERLRSAGPAASSAPLAVQLQLSAEQTEQMRQAWEAVRDTEDDCYKQAQAIERKRDQALVDMLTDEQKAKFALVDKGFADQYAALKARRDTAFADAFAKTEGILTEAQRVKYEQIVRDRLGRSPQQPGATTEPSEPSLEDFRP
jgi:hypothetical protein